MLGIIFEWTTFEQISRYFLFFFFIERYQHSVPTQQIFLMLVDYCHKKAWLTVRDLVVRNIPTSILTETESKSMQQMVTSTAVGPQDIFR